MRKVAAALCAGVSLLCITNPALAQTGQVIDETPPPGTELPTSEPEGADRADDTGELAPSNEIVVSARRRAESVQDVPQTVNVVTAAQVEKLNLRNFTEIQSVVPGLQLQSQGAFSNQATVRGIAFAPEASGNNPSVEFYLNDAPISSAFLFQSTFDFGQFELQRGPQGTLRGRAAPSGQIAVTTRRPDLDEVGAVFNGTITDLHARKVDGAFNIPIIAEVLAVRVAGVIDNNRADRVRSIKEAAFPAFNEDGPFNRTKSIRGSVRFEPTDWAQFNFMYQNLHNVRHGFSQVVSNSLIDPAAAAPTSAIVNGFNFTPVISPFDRLSLLDLGSYNRQDQDVYIGNADFRFAGQRLSYVGAYTKQDNGIIAAQDDLDLLSPVRINFADRNPGAIVGFDQVCPDEAVRQGTSAFTNQTQVQCTHSSSIRKSHEVRLASEERLFGIFDYVAGAFFDRNRPESNIFSETPFVNLGTRSVTFNPTGTLRRGSSKERSFFGNLTAHLLDDRLELSGGIRFINFKQNDLPTLQVSTAAAATTCPDFPTIRCAPLGVGRVVNFEANPTVYTGSVKYKITDDIMVYALTGSSWRPGPRVVGNFSVGPTGIEGPTQEAQFLNLPNETSKGYEIGAKTSFLGGRGRFNIAAYHQKFKNYPFRGPQVFFVSFSAPNQQNPNVSASVGNFNFVSPVPVTVKGVEGELSFDITDRWSVGVNASYSDGKIKNGTIACNDLDRNGIPDINAAQPALGTEVNPAPGTLRNAVGPGNTIGVCSGVTQRANTTPKFSGNIQSEYGFDLGANNDAFVRGLYSFFGKSTVDPNNVFDDVPFYGLLNLYAGIRDKDGAWELTVFGKNITKEREILTVGGTALASSFRNQNGQTVANPFVSEYRSISVTAPREFGVTAKIALGSR